ncbi:MAG: hypothetical protein HY674_18905 [Chloroflexi bacterium]|nr:hypothetical protein [Chloroflexota bacterium]
MNIESKLKLQAYLDNELSSEEARQVAAWMAQDPEARVLCEELKAAKAVLAGNEVEFKVPETREFYWSQIEREINRLAQAEAVEPASAGISRWLRWLAPLAGAAVLVAVLFSAGRLNSFWPGSLASLQEIETPLAETSAISFHSQEVGITVVWVDTGGIYREGDR